MERGEANRLGRNFIAVTGSLVFSQVLTLAISISIGRILGAETYGLLVFGFAFPGLFLIVMTLGMNSVFNIDVAADQSKAQSYLTAIAVLRIPLFVAVLVILVVSLQFALPDPSARVIAMILGASVVFGEYANTFGLVFSAFERFEYAALVTVGERIVTTSVVLTLLLTGSGLLPVAVAHLAGSGVILVLSLAILRRRFVWFARRAKPGLQATILKKSAPFAVTGAVYAVMNASAPVLATVLGSLTATGMLNAANTLLTALLAPLSIYATVSLPAMSRLSVGTPEKLSLFLQKTQKLAFSVGLPLAVGGWFYASDIVTLLYGEGFRGASASFGILIFGVGVATATLGNGTVLAATNRQNYNVAMAIVQTAMIIGLCFLLIPAWGAFGAATALIVSGTVAGAVATALVVRLVTKLDLRKTLVRPIVSGLGMLALLYFAKLPLWLGVPAGAAAYFSILLLLRGITAEDVQLVREAVRGILPQRRKSW